VVRDLPAEEWEKLRAFEPWATQGLPSEEHSRIIVAEQGGAIIAYWGIFTAIHVEPLWIHPDHRRRPGLVRRLWGSVVATLQGAGIRTAFACIADADAAQNVPLALRRGFERMPGDLYFVHVDPEVVKES
jgi:ribosomal protein S18 acetylase RimI-like enzyme